MNAAFHFHETPLQYQYERGLIDENAYNLTRLFTRLICTHIFKYLKNPVATFPQSISVHDYNILRFQKTLLYFKNSNFHHAKPTLYAAPTYTFEQTELMLACAKMSSPSIQVS